MKKFVLTGIALLAMAVGSLADERIVFVDLEQVFNDFYKTQLAKSKMELQREDIAAERQMMVDEMTVISDEVDVLKKESRDTTLVEEVRTMKRVQFEERLIDLRKKQDEIKEFSERRQQQLQQQVGRMSQTLMDEIRESVISYARTEGLHAVIDSSTRKAAVGVFIYTHPDVDITRLILNRLNSERPFELDNVPEPETSEPKSEL